MHIYDVSTYNFFNCKFCLLFICFLKKEGQVRPVIFSHIIFLRVFSSLFGLCENFLVLRVYTTRCAYL